MTHPYKSLPPEAFWSRAVAGGGYDPSKMVGLERPLLRAGEKVASAGSCFAANVVPYLEAAGFEYVRTESAHPDFAPPPNPQFGYHAFSAAYGHIYTTRQLLQLLLRALGRFAPSEDRWHVEGNVIDPFRPGLEFPARSDREFDLLTRQHLARTHEALEFSDVFIFTLGLTECWASKQDLAVFPACPGTVAGAFDPSKHVFLNLSCSEVRADLEAIVALLRELNPKLRLILTVSPVPLVATATNRHVVAATTYSKSALVAAAVETSFAHDHVAYFPSYEMITGPQAPDSYFQPDRRNVSAEAVRAVMKALLPESNLGEDSGTANALPQSTRAQLLSQEISRIECEEMAVEKP